MVDRALWISLEREINRFRTMILGLEPLRMGQGAWNLVNILQVPFVKMWSPSFVPKPKDWPDYIDIVGAFSEHINDAKKTASRNRISLKSFNEIEHHYKIYQSTISQGQAIDPNVRAAKSEDSLLPIITNSSSYQPTEELASFLTGNQPIIYVGFGSMVVKDIEKIISLFLEAAAMINVKVLIQIGWSIITPEKFMLLAAEAQLKAGIVRETEKINSNMAESIIFPSKNKTEGSGSITGTPSNSRNSSVDEPGRRRSESSSAKASSSSASLGGWLLGKIANNLNLSSTSSSKKDYYGSEVSVLFILFLLSLLYYLIFVNFLLLCPLDWL
jgi:hypothetical protein